MLSVYHDGSLDMKIARVGLDIAKQAFQVHGVDEHENPRLRKQLRRENVLQFFAQLPACVVGMEACASSHYWARELTKLGHTVKLIAAQFVISYRTSGKNDANDAEAICEAVGRPKMHFVAVKTQEQQSVLTVHRARSLVVANRTAQVNQIRGLLGEFGLVVPKGPARLRRELPRIIEDAENGLPELARQILDKLRVQFRIFDAQVAEYDQLIREIAVASEPARRLMKVEAIGPQTATALVASMGDPHAFDSGRNYAASIGLTPRQRSTGGKQKLGAITRQGDSYVRTLLVHGARAYLRVVGKKTDRKSAWARGLLERRHVNIAAVALAAKHARIAWAILAHGTEYRPAGPEVVAA
jgi:transposase